MFNGRFGNTSGAPYLETLVILPRLGIRSGVSFLVDTGADETVLMPADAIKMGVDYNKLLRGHPLVGIGGQCKSFKEQAIIALSDNDRKLLFAYEIDIKIVDDRAAINKHGYCPSLLGRDILKHLKMRYDPKERMLVFTLLSADVAIPLNERSAQALRKELRSSVSRRRLPNYPD